MVVMGDPYMAKVHHRRRLTWESNSFGIGQVRYRFYRIATKRISHIHAYIDPKEHFANKSEPTNPVGHNLSSIDIVNFE